MLGIGNGFTYPAYSALLPSILPAEDLMAANGVEGMLRPTIMQAAGPAVASALIARLVAGRRDRRGGGLVGWSASRSCSRVRPVPLRRDPAAAPAHPVRGVLVDLATASSTWCARRGCSPRCCSPPC